MKKENFILIFILIILFLSLLTFFSYKAGYELAVNNVHEDIKLWYDNNCLCDNYSIIKDDLEWLTYPI